MLPAMVFDDAPTRLSPLTDLRASFEVRTGALTTLERHGALLASFGSRLAGVWVDLAHEPLARDQVALPVNDPAALGSAKEALVVNGRCAILPEEAAELPLNAALIDEETGDVLVARLASAAALEFLAHRETHPGVSRTPAKEPGLLTHPWDVIRLRDQALDIDLEFLAQGERQALPEGVIAIGEHDLRISPEALVYPSVVLDAEGGPIVIDDHAVVRPGVIIIGPAYVGRGSTVLDRALIKPHTAIGPVCKVAGEVGGSIFQGYANKAHDGHLGDSWVGAWANFGAGTTNSNLLNTYANVIAQAAPDAQRQRTGLRYLGCIVGDHVKLAIMTRIMTGSVLGTGCMIAAQTCPTCLGPMQWVTDEAGAVARRPYRPDKFIEVATTVMARRSVTPSESYLARVRSLSR